jgi:Na+-transporting methylmalonyl-CoA/oxaloacetate decarboxylase gamma subunit
MTDIITRYAEAAFALLVTGAAMVYPPLALIVAAAYLIGLAIVSDRRTPPSEAPK